MTREISATLDSDIAGPITRPGYLLEILFSEPVRLSTRGTVNVLGNEWTAWGFGITGIGVDATSANQTGTLTLANTEFDISTLVLEEGIAGRPIRVWKFYGEEPEDADAILLFEGVGGEASIDSSNGTVRVSLQQERGAVQFAPSRYITVEQGFSMLPPPGTVIHFAGQSYILQPETF